MSGHDTRTVSRLRAFAAAQEDDSGLLGRFLECADADAFQELVRRHGPLVLGVCRRVLGNGPDADDAFQAAFLVLARRAGSVRNARSVGSWLFGVARFAALRARDKERRRREHEAQAAREPRPGTETDAELLAAVDEELQRLPERYRAPLVACFLQGRTQEDAAKQLGWSLSTLRRRLERAQELLRRRLTARGVVPALGALAVSAGGLNVSAVIVETTTALVVTFINGEARSVPATVLAEGVLAMVARTKLKVLLTAALVLAALVGGGVAWQLAAANPPQPVAPSGPPAGAKIPEKPQEPPAKDKDTKPVEDRIKPGDRLTVRARHVAPDEPLDGQFEVEASGKILLGPAYGGRIKIDGLTLEEAEVTITKHLEMVAFLTNPVVMVTRYSPPEGRAMELRVLQLELEVKQLRILVEELRKQKP